MGASPAFQPNLNLFASEGARGNSLPLSGDLTIADIKRANWLVETLPLDQPGLFNPWRDECLHDSLDNGPTARLNRLAFHLACNPKLVLVGEAPGYQGCRYSGIAFTSERLLLEGMIPRVPSIHHRLTKRIRPFSEPSATIVWDTLYRLRLQESTLLWNALQMHPYRPEKCWSNRTPTKDELVKGKECLTRLMALFPEANFVAVGNKARDLMRDMLKVEPAATVRHPANGGARRFAKELNDFRVQQGL